MDSDIPSPRSVSVTGPIGHSNDYQSCWRIFCMDFDIVLDTLTRSVNRQTNESEFETVFIGTKSIYKFSSQAVSCPEYSVIVSSLSLPGGNVSTLSDFPSDISIPPNSPTVLVHGVSPSWKPSRSSPNWHALDFYANPLSERSLINFIANMNLLKISKFILWGIDGIPSNCLIKLLKEWRNSKSTIQLIFVSQSLMYLDASFIALFDTHSLVNISKPPDEEPAKTNLPEIDVSRIPPNVLEFATTNFVLPITEPKLIAPFSSIVSMAPRVLIHGPSKSGKTTLAKWMIRSVQSKSNINVIEIHASQLFSKYLGGSEKRIEKLFKKAAASAPCVILLEGIHSICPSRGVEDDEEEGGGVGQTYTRVLATFLMCLDGIDTLGTEHNKVALIGTSLVGPDKLDPAAVRPGRLELHIALD